MSNILEEYLVRISAEIDKNAFNGATRAITKLAGALDKIGSVMKYTGLLAAIAKVTESVVDNIRAVAAADMEYQKLAQNMWVTKETAKSLSVVLKTMGASQDDVAWVPELREQFFRLRQEMNALATPADSDGQLRWIREIGYDVQSLQLKLKMLREWLVYYLIKYLQPYIKQFQEFIRWLNEKLGKNMPAIAKKVASALASIVSLAVSFLKLIKNIGEGVYNFLEKLPAKTKAMVAVFSIVGAAIMSGPFGMMMMAIGTALLMLEDFFYYVEGKKSSRTLAPLWKWMTDENNPLKRTVATVKQAIEDIVNRLSDIVYKIFTSEVRDDIVRTLYSINKAILSIAGGIASICSDLTKNSDKVNAFWDNFADGAQRAVLKTLRISRVLSSLLSAMGEALQGNWTAAKMELINAMFEAGTLFTDTTKDMGGFSGLGGNSGGADRAAELVARQPESLKGNPNGCTEFIRESLGRNNDFMESLGNDLWVPNWVLEAKKQGRYTAGAEGMQRGDIAVIDFGEGVGDHVVMYDGDGGYYGNSTSQQRPVHGSMSDWSGGSRGRVMGYIRTGTKKQTSADASHGGAGGPYDSLVSPTSYAAGYVTGGTAGIMPMANNTSNYNGGVINMGGIVVNCGNVSNPQQIAAAVSDRISQRLAASGGSVVV